MTTAARILAVIALVELILDMPHYAIFAIALAIFIMLDARLGE